MNQRPGKLLLSILGGLILLLLIGTIAGRSQPHTTPTPAAAGAPTPTHAQAVTTSESPAPPASTAGTLPAEAQGQDRYNDTSRFRDYEREQQLSRPAYQHLPYRTSHVRIAIANVTSDGRIVLSVTPLGPNVSPKAEYGAFLARYHDPGLAYLAVYGRYGR